MHKFNWVTETTRNFMKKGYLTGQSVEERCTEVSLAFEDNLVEMGLSKEQAAFTADKFLEYLSYGYYSLSTPVWVAYGNNRGLPVSCFGSYVPDTMDGILYTASEVGMLTKLGGGTSAYLGELRPRGTPITGNGEADGPAHFARLYNSIMQVARQGSRRGYLAAYLDATHPDIEEFLQIGSDSSDIQNITTGVCFSNEFLQGAYDGNAEYQEILSKYHKARGAMGYPYALFTDNANNQRPQVYKDKDMKIVASNLCNEIMLPSSKDESFVCVLSSMNLVHYDAWKETDAVKVMTYFLDSVVHESIKKLSALRKKEDHFFLERIERFLINHRALGLGVLGYHHLLQSKMLPFESRDAAKLNVEIFRTLQQQSHAASKELASLLGEPPLLVGYGMRNTTTMAIAPTKSSSTILGSVSEGIQPELANAYVADLAKVVTLIKNPYLKAYLQTIDMDTEEVWKSIEANAGSVQHLTFLSDEVKDVFKTFPEISPKAVIEQAAARQTYIDQGQSLNLIFPPSMSPSDINYLFYYAWRLGIKGLYYQIGMSATQAHNVQQLNLKECVACSA